MTFNILSRVPRLTAEHFHSFRSYFYVLALVIGACFTDSPSGKEQVMIAVPLMPPLSVGQSSGPRQRHDRRSNHHRDNHESPDEGQPVLALFQTVSVEHRVPPGMAYPV